MFAMLINNSTAYDNYLRRNMRRLAVDDISLNQENPSAGDSNDAWVSEEAIGQHNERVTISGPDHGVYVRSSQIDKLITVDDFSRGDYVMTAPVDAV